MRFVFEKTKQKELFTEFKNANNLSWREMSRTLNIDWKALREYRDEKYTLPDKIFEKIITKNPEFNKYTEFIVEKRKTNWGAAEGGRKRWEQIRKKLKSDRKFRKKWIENCIKGGKKRLELDLIKGWDSGFRNLPRRKIKGPKGEKMFSLLEENVAKIFLQNGLEYEYEPLIIVNGNRYFPDFLVNKKFIVEAFGFSSQKYYLRMKTKLKDYLSLKKKVILIIPNKMNSVYEKRIKFNRKFIRLIVSRDFNELNQYILEFIGGK